MEGLRVWMMLLFFYFAIAQARSINPKEKEGEVLQRAVRDLFMIYQQERITTRLVGLREGDSGKPLNESDKHVTKASGQLSLSDGNRSDEISDISAPFLDTDKPDTDDEKIDLLLRLYAILRKHSVRREDSEINVSDDGKNIDKLWGEFEEDGRNEANKTVTNGEWQYIRSLTDPLSKIREDDHMTLRNDTRTAGDDVDSPGFDADDVVASVDLHKFINNVSSREYSGSNGDMPDLGYLLGLRSDEEEDDGMETEVVNRGDDERFDEYDFISFKRSEADRHNKSVNVLGNDNSTNNNISKTNSLEDVDDDEAEDDEGEGDDDYDDDDYDDDGHDDHEYDVDDLEDYDKFYSGMNPNYTEQRSAKDNQGTPNNPIIRKDMYDHGEHLDEVVDDHGDDHGRTLIRDEDAERFLRWLLGYILRRMDDGSESERIPNSDEETMSSQDEATVTIRKYLANGDKRGEAKQHHSFTREGSLQPQNDGMAQTWSDMLRKGDTEKSRIALEERDEDPGTLLLNIINMKELERRRQIRDLVERLAKKIRDSKSREVYTP